MTPSTNYLIKALEREFDGTGAGALLAEINEITRLSKAFSPGCMVYAIK
jgi:hypothetical protein